MTTPRHLTGLARTLRRQDTWAEQLLWRWLRDRRFSPYKLRRQHPFGDYILDFFCLEARLNIELDGRQHGFPEGLTRDCTRDAELERKGIKVLRFWNGRLRREKEVLRGAIWQALQERAPHPLPDYCQPMVTAAKKGENHRAACVWATFSVLRSWWRLLPSNSRNTQRNPVHSGKRFSGQAGYGDSKEGTVCLRRCKRSSLSLREGRGEGEGGVCSLP